MSSRVMRRTDDAVPSVSRPSGWSGKSAACQRSRRQVGRLVGVHQDLVEDDRALGLDVVGPQRRLPHDVAQDVEPERQVLGEQPDVEGRVLLGGEGVAVAAHLVERLGDGRGRALARCP